MSQIQSNIGIPNYLQLKTILKEMILDDPSIENLPPEKSLAEQYEVSYMTVRHAISELVDEGLITRQAGRGTFVNKPGKVKNKTYCIGYIRSDKTGDIYMSEDEVKLFTGIYAVFAKRGYQLTHILDRSTLVSSEDPAQKPKIKLDGILYYDPYDKEELNKIIRFTSTVLLESRIQLPDITTVNIDNYNAFKLGIQHVYDLGHRRIAHITGDLKSFAGKERLRAYKDKMKELGLSIEDSLIIKSNFSFEGGEISAQALLQGSHKPTAICAANDLSAAGANRWCHENGLVIGKDISIVGFDDLAPAYFNYPPLTTVHAPKRELGAEAANALINIIETGDVGNPQTLLPAELIIRKSTGPVP